VLHLKSLIAIQGDASQRMGELAAGVTSTSSSECKGKASLSKGKKRLAGREGEIHFLKGEKETNG